MSLKPDKIANSFYLPKHSFLRGIASLIDFTGSESREFTEQLLARSNADAIRADWEVVGDSLRQAMDGYGRQLKENAISER